MATLNTAVTLPEMDDIATSVGQHLHLDMAGMIEIFLDIDRIVSECRLRLGRASVERLLETPRRSARSSCLGRRRLRRP